MPKTVAAKLMVPEVTLPKQERVAEPEGETPIGLIGVMRMGTRWTTVELEVTPADWRALRRRAKTGERLSLGFLAGALSGLADDLAQKARVTAAGPKAKR